MPAVALAAWAGVGCRHAEPADTVHKGPPPERDFKWNEQPLGGVAATAAKPVAVAEGKAPLLYLSDLAATVRIVDRSSESLLAEVTVRPRTIVRVDERNGVVAGSETLVAGPLPKGRRYAIYVVPDEQSITRTGTFQPRPPRKAAEPDNAGTQDSEKK